MGGWLVGWVGGWVDGWVAAAAMQQCSSDALANSLASGNNTIEKGGGHGRVSGTQVSGRMYACMYVMLCMDVIYVCNVFHVCMYVCV